ncbi:MAG: asparagine synthase (glutamine-hydrolyzing) [Bryobacteraceae bacterium]
MCGIAGWVGANLSAAQDAVSAMLPTLARRGPDAEGIEVWNRAVLGHRRLSIFDLSEAGRQPMVSADRSAAVVFNGAIYNFRELRSELEASDCRFLSHTDTEVILHGYRKWGMDRLLARLHGMFAIGIWDDRAGKLYLVRDRLGVKPLYYTVRPGGSLAFASTARALRTANLAGNLNPIAIAEFLEFGYVTDAHCVYHGVQKLGAAELLEWSNGSIQRRRYWQPSSAEDHKPIRFEEAVDRSEQLLLDAVKMRLFADVPVGALLSGGVDSSLVCWAVSKLGGNLTAYTIATPGEPGDDESADAVATAKALGIPQKILHADPEEIARGGIDEMVAAYGEPFACSSALGMLQLSRVIKPEATVLLTGDGGDDVFLGYPDHKNLWLAQRTAQWIPRPLAKKWYSLRKRALRHPKLRRPAHFLDYTTGGLAAVAMAHDGWPLYEHRGMLGERLATIRLPQRRMRWSIGAGRRVLTDMLVYHREGQFAGEYLTKVDGSTMYYGLEARSPFLDQMLWEFASALPYPVRLHGGELKAVLRALARRHLGARVAEGRKRGFTIPAQRWLATRWLGHARELFHHSLLDSEGWVRSAAVLKQLDVAAARQTAPLQLWYLYILENWLRYERAHGAPPSGAERLERSVA